MEAAALAYFETVGIHLVDFLLQAQRVLSKTMKAGVDTRLVLSGFYRDSGRAHITIPLGSLRARSPYLLVITIALLACTPPNQNIAYQCPLDVKADQHVLCALFDVPERHDRPGGKVVQVAVAQFKSANPNALPDPLVLLSGGPGDSNFENFFPVLSSPLGEVLLSNRDVVVIESRGLYHSIPNLVADEIFAVQLEMVERNVNGPEANGKLLEAMQLAHGRFVNERVDLPAYNHRETAADINLVLTALGYDRFNLFGTSAGTIVAQQIMRDYPARLRAVILNAAVPNAPDLFEQMFGNAARSLSRYFAMCESEEACSAAYPEAEARFLRMLARLNASPVGINATNPATNDEATLVLNGDKLSSWVFASMYWNTQIVRSIDRFLKGDFTEIRKSPDIFFPMTRFSYALAYTATIADSPEFVATSGPIPDGYRAFVDGLSLFFSPHLIEATRELWRDEQTTRATNEPLVSDTPTLVMNGALDHVIPSESLDQLVSGLQGAYVFVFDGVAHSPVDAGECAVAMMMEFLADPSKAPDSSCMEDYRHAFALPE